MITDEQHDRMLIAAARTRAAIRRSISTRKSVQEGKPDRIADLLDSLAIALEKHWETKK